MSQLRLHKLITGDKHKLAVIEDDHTSSTKTLIMPNAIDSSVDYDLRAELSALNSTYKTYFDQTYNLIDIVTNDSYVYNGSNLYKDNILLLPFFDATDFNGASYTNEAYDLDDPLQSALQLGFDKEWIMLTGIGNVGYALVKRTNDTPNYKQDQFNSYKTLLSVYQMSDPVDFSTSFNDPKVLIEGIKFNFVAEIPLDFYYFDYDNAVSFYNLFKLKNMYDARYHMIGSIESGDIEQIELSNIRKYNNMGYVSPNKMWLSYNYQNNYSSVGLTIIQDYLNNNFKYGFIESDTSSNTPLVKYGDYFNGFSILNGAATAMAYWLPMVYDEYEVELKIHSSATSKNFLTPTNIQTVTDNSSKDMIGFVISTYESAGVRHSLCAVRSVYGTFGYHISETDDISWALVYCRSDQTYPTVISKNNSIDDFKGQYTTDEAGTIFFSLDSAADTGMKIKIVKTASKISCYAMDIGVSSHEDEYNTPWKDAVLELNYEGGLGTYDGFFGGNEIGFVCLNRFCYFEIEKFNNIHGLPNWNEIIAFNDATFTTDGEMITCDYDDSASSWTDTGLKIQDFFGTGSIKDITSDTVYYVGDDGSIDTSFTVTDINNFIMSFDGLDSDIDSSNKLKDYDFLEVIEHVNKFAIDKKHKSNLYSVELKNTGLNEGITDSDTRSLVQDSVSKVIRDISKNIQPANTRLFKIEFTGS